MPERNAWECPRCHKVNAPHVDQCSCDGNAVIGIPLPPQPIVPPVTVPYVPWPYSTGTKPLDPPFIVTCGSTTTSTFTQ